MNRSLCPLESTALDRFGRRPPGKPLPAGAAKKPTPHPPGRRQVHPTASSGYLGRPNFNMNRFLCSLESTALDRFGRRLAEKLSSSSRPKTKPHPRAGLGSPQSKQRIPWPPKLQRESVLRPLEGTALDRFGRRLAEKLSSSSRPKTKPHPRAGLGSPQSKQRILLPPKLQYKSTPVPLKSTRPADRFGNPAPSAITPPSLGAPHCGGRIFR